MVLKQILEAAKCVSSDYIALMPPNTDNTLSKGYQIHIKTNLAMCNRASVEEVAKKYQLILRQEGELLVIYKPLGKQ